MENDLIYDDDALLLQIQFLNQSLSMGSFFGVLNQIERYSSILWDIKQYGLLSGKTAEKMELFLETVTAIQFSLKTEAESLQMELQQFLTAIDEADGDLY